MSSQPLSENRKALHKTQFYWGVPLDIIALSVVCVPERLMWVRGKTHIQEGFSWVLWREEVSGDLASSSLPIPQDRTHDAAECVILGEPYMGRAFCSCPQALVSPDSGTVCPQKGHGTSQGFLKVRRKVVGVVMLSIASPASPTCPTSPTSPEKDAKSPDDSTFHYFSNQGVFSPKPPLWFYSPPSINNFTTDELKNEK